MYALNFSPPEKYFEFFIKFLIFSKICVVFFFPIVAAGRTQSVKGPQSSKTVLKSERGQSLSKACAKSAVAIFMLCKSKLLDLASKLLGRPALLPGTRFYKCTERDTGSIRIYVI